MSFTCSHVIGCEGEWHAMAICVKLHHVLLHVHCVSYCDSVAELQAFRERYDGNTNSEIEFNHTDIYGCREGPSYINCHLGESHCYNRAELCIYDTIEVRVHRA